MADGPIYRGRVMPEGAEGQSAWVMMDRESFEIVECEWYPGRWRDPAKAVLYPGDPVLFVAVFTGEEHARDWLTRTLGE